MARRWVIDEASMTNPILIEITRGELVESVHTGALAVSRPNGELLLSIGNIHRPVYPRSAVKAFQAIPVFETGAADALEFSDADIALACASHSGTEAHVSRASDILSRAKLSERDLGCGAHMPMGEETMRRLLQSGTVPNQLHNNCSGKHAAMVGTCAHCGNPVAGYTDVTHPHQQRIAQVLADVMGDGFDARCYGIDGCSAPNWAVPLKDLANGFAKLATGEGLSKDRAKISQRIMRACWAAPEMVAGPGRLDTTVMTELPGRVFTKTGAEGVYCGAFPELGLGFALKIDDGNPRASMAVAEWLIRHLIPAAPAFDALGPMKNWRGTRVGDIRTAEALTRRAG
jgi:L-asparaginase II